MIKTENKHGHRGAIGYHAEKPVLLMPKIIGQKFADGIKYYLGENGKMYIAEAFDRMFATVKGQVRKKNFKGTILNQY